MGNSTPTPGPSPVQECNDFTHCSESTHPVLGRVYYYKNKHFDNTFIALDNPPGESTGLSSELILMHIGTLPKLPRLGGSERSGACNTFETFDIDLEFELCQRFIRGKTYLEAKDIWSLVYTLLRVLLLMEEKGEMHGCLSLKTILIKNYDFKMIVPRLMGLHPLSFIKLDQKSYHSPAVRKSLLQGALPPLSILFQDDLFGAGLLMLEAATLNMPKTFHLDSGELDIEWMHRALTEIKDTSSPEIYTLIREMVVLDPANRLSLQQINTLLTQTVDPSLLTRIGQSAHPPLTTSNCFAQ